MDIGQVPAVIVHPLRAPSNVDDGEVGQNGNYYRRSPRRKSQEPDEQAEPEQPCPQETTSPAIDLLV